MDATLTSHARTVAARPELTRFGPLGTLNDDLPPRTLLHAGPPFQSVDDLPRPVRNALTAAARLEGWIKDGEAGLAAVRANTLTLAPAQDHGVVTPLALIAGPSTPALEVRDDALGLVKWAPLNDGPPASALRFGTGSDAGLAELVALGEGIAADIAAHLDLPLPLLPLMTHGLDNGDDLHSRLDATQAAFVAMIKPGVSPAAQAYLARAGQFVLNPLMAGAAVMLAAGAGLPASKMVVAAGGNGQDFGWKEAGGPDWIVRPAARPEGPRLPHREGTTPLPAIGDSAVLDALGFGAACLRFAPDVARSLAGLVDPAYATAAAHEPFLGPHPELPAGVRIGLDLTRARLCLGVVLGMVEEGGTGGLIGRGIAPWPAP